MCPESWRAERNEGGMEVVADDGDALMQSHRVVLASARELGVDETTLPDFLAVRPLVIGGRLPGVTS